MNEFYVNVDRIGNNILLTHYMNGELKRKKLHLKPSFYIPTNFDTPYRSIDGESLEKRKFDSMRDASVFKREYEGMFDVYGMENFTFQYMNQRYGDDIVEYDNSKININFVDIETSLIDDYGKRSGFPNPEECKFPITAITLYSSINREFNIFGVGEWEKTEEFKHINVKYHRCISEKDLMFKFLDVWREDYPHIISGWNSAGFDIPYIINRFRKVLGESVTKKLSPWGKIKERETKGSFGKKVIQYTIVGISHLDYLDVYKKHARSARESYKLDFIGKFELKESKIDYKSEGYKDLQDLYERSHQRYIDYNLMDVDLLVRLESKLKYLELVISIAYYSKVNFDEVHSVTKCWDSIIYHKLLKDNVVIPPKKHFEKDGKYEGAYVKPPIIGLHDWILSYDLNSLYPHLIMQYNLGVDTLVEDVPDELKSMKKDFDDILNKKIDLSLLKKHNLCMAANGTFYRSDKKGLFPFLMEMLYKERKADKRQMLDYKSELETVKENDPNNKEKIKELEYLISKYNNFQEAKKVLLNSLYGGMGTPYFRYYDLRIAEAITISGQLSIKWIANSINAFMNKNLKTENVDYIVAIDTDSNYVNFGPLFNKVLPEGISKEDAIDMIDKFSKDIMEPYIARKYDELADYVNAFENKMVMEREVIADKAFWTAKKRYVLNVWDSEGVRYKEPKLKILGLESKKSDTPQVCRDKLEEAYKIIVQSDESDMHKLIEDFREEWKTLPVDAISFPSSCNGISKYYDSSRIFKSGTPRHVKGALIFNNTVEKKDASIDKIVDGEKVKYVDLKKPNPIQQEVISFVDELPDELGLNEYIDYDGQFEKAFMKPLKPCLDVAGWKSEETNDLGGFFV